MPTLRSAWNPVTPLAAVLVASLLALLSPPEQRPGWLGLVVVLLSPVAAFASVRALGAALARLPAAPGGAPTSAEGVLTLALRALLVAVAVLVPVTTLFTELGVRSGALGEGERALTLALPLALGALGAQLWRDLRAARAERATEVEARRRTKATLTGVAELDTLVGRPPRAAAWVAWVLGFTSAAAWVAGQVVHGQPVVSMLAKVNDRVAAGEVWRVFTATAVHGSLAALLLNGAAFFAVAPLLELLLGAPRLVFVFVVAGVAATFASYGLAAGPYLGASGAIAGVAGALLAFALRRRRDLPVATRRRAALRGALALGTVSLAAGLLPDVDLPAIAGGLAFGLVAGLAFDPPEDVRTALASVKRSPGQSLTRPALRD
jgi:membrane associated rhomboid family serine protease